MTELPYLTIEEAGSCFRTGDLSPVTLTEAMLERIESLNPICHAFINVTGDTALVEAKRAETEIRAGKIRGPLHGIPYALKDIIDVAGLVTTAHSKILLGNIAAADATVVTKLRDAGAVLLGKLALHEFATGGPAFDLPFPPARNPWNLAYHPGGSSSGSAVALAAGLIFGSVGTDTGGSVRNPATCCGIVGLKPTYGLISRAGMFPLSFSLDHAGPLARTVKECAVLLGVVAGKDPADPASRSAISSDYTSAIDSGVKNLRIGVIEHFHTEDAVADAEMKASLESSIEIFRDLGARIQSVRLASLDKFAQCGRVIQQAESFAIHRGWLRERPEDYCQLSLSKLAAGAFLGAADYVEAQQARRLLCAQFNEVISGYDALITLSGHELPTRLDDPADTALKYERHARMPFNVTGTPALAVPTGFSKSGLPLGLQIIGRAFDEAMLFRIGFALEKALGLADQRPPLLEKQRNSARKET